MSLSLRSVRRGGVASCLGLVWGACASPTDAPLVTSESASSVALSASASASSSSSSSPRSEPFTEALALQPAPLREAVERARTAKKLVLVEVWAPWCAPCAVFKREVLTVENRATLSARVELVELDLDREDTAPFTARYGVFPLPSVLVLDPKDGTLLAQRSGHMPFTALESMIEAAPNVEDSGRDALIDARRDSAEGRKTEAARALAFMSGVTNGTTRQESIVTALDLFREAGELERCVNFARSAMASRGLAQGAMGEFRLSIMQSHLLCSLGMDDIALRKKELAWLEEQAKAFERTFDADQIAPRVRADLHALASLIATDRGDAREARRRDEARVREIDRAIALASATKDPLVAASFDADRTSTLLALGRESEALAALRARSTKLPNNYEVHGRLGTTLARVGKHAESLEPLTRAVELAYGAPKFIYLHRLADAHAALGDQDNARARLGEAKAGWAALAESQRDSVRAAAVDRALAALE